MSVEVAQVVIDCSDAEKLAGFWAQLLQRPVEPGANAFYALIPGSPALMLLAVPEAKQVKNRVHLDLRLAEGSDWEGELGRILALGATQVSEHREHGVHWVCLRDPEGNEFDLAIGH
ncbi:glyoxalase [Kineosporia sp. NBRC 101677]|uniref:VOC family protein n=1 Tax=Kineosporia sp. NBRC 101677 TaxID=3032197 RepID=UPI0024A2F400|nr:VOC family protein [Kineosporia sp. NBRC 101677]GLY16458.1 glyoxalase [Kineosporia sp. NBRC 101677]